MGATPCTLSLSTPSSLIAASTVSCFAAADRDRRPDSAKPRAMARPIPRVAPVTMAFFPQDQNGCAWQGILENDFEFFMLYPFAATQSIPQARKRAADE